MKILIRNTEASRLPIHVEPWGEDYWVNSSDEIRLSTDSATAYFSLEFSSSAITVYVEGDPNAFATVRDREGNILQCGSGRPKKP
jgi:hypothetical protein